MTHIRNDAHNYSTRNCDNIIGSFHRLTSSRDALNYFSPKLNDVLLRHIKPMNENTFQNYKEIPHK